MPKVMDGGTWGFELVTAPGGVASPETRRRVAQGADAVVFVVPSQRERLEASAVLLRELDELVARDRRAPRRPPVILQCNMRDLPTAIPLQELQEHLNAGARLPHVETIAVRGLGVREALDAAWRGVRQALREAP